MDFRKIEGSLEYECNRELCRFLAAFEEQRVTIKGSDVLQLSHPTMVCQPFINKPPAPLRFYLPWPRPQAIEPWFVCPPDLLEFYRHFDGLREEPPGNSGYFYPWAEVPKFMEEYADREEMESSHLADLLDAPEIFCAANGDRIILSPEDGFLWFQLRTGIPTLADETFGIVLSAWVRHHAAGICQSFDSRAWEQKI
jgi:hypothetical protein